MPVMDARAATEQVLPEARDDALGGSAVPYGLAARAIRAYASKIVEQLGDVALHVFGSSSRKAHAARLDSLGALSWRA